VKHIVSHFMLISRGSFIWGAQNLGYRRGRRKQLNPVLAKRPGKPVRNWNSGLSGFSWSSQPVATRSASRAGSKPV